MKLSAADFGRIKGTIILLLIVCAGGAGGVYWTFQQLHTQQAATKAAESKVAEARRRVSRVQLEKEDLSVHYPHYLALVKRGLVGQDQRLDWIETVENLGRKHGLFSLHYTLGGQRPFQAPAAADVREGFNALESPLELDVTVLHEEQLAGFLADLRGQIQGLVVPDRCTVERIGSVRDLRFGPQLKATCSLRLVNLLEKKGA